MTEEMKYLYRRRDRG